MLTKDLLKYTSRGDRIFPKYLPLKETQHLQMAGELDATFQNAVGQKQVELDERLKKLTKKQDVVFQGFCKLLSDRCEFNETEDAIEEQRWRWFQAASDLRKNQGLSVEGFQQKMSENFQLPFESLANSLYGDLPDCRTISAYKSLSAEALVHRYNAAQIQGLLLRAHKIQITVKDGSVLKRRRLLQRLKFWRLMAEFKEEGREIELTISGPLALFESNQNYGMRLCNFFPVILLMDKWSINAEIKMGEKISLLQVDSSKPISSHYKDFTGHIPQEFKLLMEAFNELPASERKGWLGEESQEAINLGQQVYCVPDMTFRKGGLPPMHMELFHKWHGRELHKRLETVEKEQNLLIGLAQELVKEKEIDSLKAKAESRGVSVFTFRKFPTPKAILTYLS